MDSSLLMLSPTAYIAQSTTGSNNITVTRVTTTPGIYKLNQDIVIGITVGLIAGIPVLAILCCCFRACCRKKQKKQRTLHSVIKSAKVSLHKQTFMSSQKNGVDKKPYGDNRQDVKTPQTKLIEPVREMTPIQRFTADDVDGVLSDEEIIYTKRPVNSMMPAVNNNLHNEDSAVTRISQTVDVIDEIETKSSKKKKRKRRSKEKEEGPSEESSKEEISEKREKREKRKKEKKEKKKERELDVDDDKAADKKPKAKKKKKSKFKATLDRLSEMED